MNSAKQHLEGSVNVAVIQEFAEQEEFAMKQVEASQDKLEVFKE
jgi:hypothetical protein